MSTPSASHDRLTSAGISEIVVKCGPQGALIGPDDLITTEENLAPVDTTAAGDSFNAGYLAARLSGQTRAMAAAAGNRLAGRVISHRGAIIPREAMP